MTLTRFQNSTKKFKDWTCIALSNWAETSQDPNGGFCELRYPDGQPNFGHVRRVRVQSRLAYVYAHAAYLGWYHDAKKSCDHAWNFVLSSGMQGGNHGCAHLVNGDGSLQDGMRDTYAQAFILLAGAWRFRAFKDEKALAIAESTLIFLNDAVKADNGGWYESWPRINGIRRQNPHMHLFEAFIALYDATEKPEYLEYAHHIYQLFKTYFWDSKKEILLEFFDDNWIPLGDGGPIEPGHMMEWVWLLREYQRISGVDVGTYCDALFKNGLSLGLNESHQLICDVVSLGESEVPSTFRSWPQTELIKAAVAQVRAGESNRLSWAYRTVDRLLEKYLSVSVPGGWIDKLDANGRPVSYVMPSSTFYHYFSAAAEAHSLSQTAFVRY